MSRNELRFRIQLTMEPFTISAALFFQMQSILGTQENLQKPDEIWLETLCFASLLQHQPLKDARKLVVIVKAQKNSSIIKEGQIPALVLLLRQSAINASSSDHQS